MFGFLKKYFIHISLVFIFSAYFFFGTQHLGQFVTADEHYWVYERIPQYWEALIEGNWKKTFINDKPGVTLALVSGIGLLFEPQPEKHFYENSDRTLVYDIEGTESLYRTFRIPLLIANAILLFYLFYIIQRLTHPWIALWTIILTALSPILLGISQIVNPDALLWSLGASALFSYFAFLTLQEKKFFWLTILLTGLAILTKYVAIILFPFYLVLIVLYCLTAPDTNASPSPLQRIQKEIRSWIAIVAGSIIILCLFLPAILMDTKYLVKILVTIPDKEQLLLLSGWFLTLLCIDMFILKNKIFLAFRTLFSSFAPHLRFFSSFFLLLFIGLIIIRNFFLHWDIFTLIPFDIKDISNARYYTDIPNFFEAFLLEWNPLVFSLTPITLIGFATLLILFSSKIKKEYAFLVNSLLFFFLVYILILIHSNILTLPRYSILLYPLFAFLAALGFWHSVKKFSWSYAPYITTIIVLCGSLWSLISIKPFYFNYTNFLLPKSMLIHDAWGYGGYEAAQYLNSLPDAQQLTVWIDYYGVCEFFVGKCLSAYTFDPSIIQPDYYVLTRRGQIRYISRADRWERLSGLTAYKYYNANSEWLLAIDNRLGNFIKVVKVEK